MKKSKLKIAQIGSVWERTPPKLYGGTERVVHNLCEELVKRGHKVTLFATGDSETSAKLRSVVPYALYRNKTPWTNFLHPLRHISEAFEKASEFDIIHMHLNTRQDYVSLALAGFVRTPTVFTLHFVLPQKDDKEKNDRFLLLKKYKDRNFIAISHAQKTLKFLNYAGVVHNGLDFSENFSPNIGQDYAVWIGRICPDKGVREAIISAKKAGVKLLIAGKLDQFDSAYLKYYKKYVEPFIDGRRVEYVGELDDKGKDKFFSNARAMLQPILWNEPFGLTTIEAMAHGVPVIAFDRGPVREQILDGKTGFIVKDTNQMAAALKKTGDLDRKFIRNYVLKNFNAEKMTDGYEKIYRQILGQKI